MGRGAHCRLLAMCGHPRELAGAFSPQTELGLRCFFFPRFFCFFVVEISSNLLLLAG